MKKIAVLVENIAVEYSQEITSGVCDFYKDKDVQLTVFPVRKPKQIDGEYDYQFWLGTKFSATSYFDAVIVVSGGFLSFMTPQELGSILGEIDENKIISVAIPIPGRNIKYTYTQCDTTYSTIINHLVKKHNCKRIACYTGLLCGSTEATERFEAYKKALEDNNLEFDSSIVFDGNFTYNNSFSNFSKLYKSKEDINFDAIVCANDMTAYGCIDALRNINVQIPQDVKIFGYDDIEKSKRISPTLSTVNQQLYDQGKEAAKLALEVAMGNSVEHATQIKLSPCYRQSCGCVPMDATLPNSEQISKEGIFTMNDVLDARVFQSTVNYFLDRMQNTETLENFYKKLDELFGSSAFTSIVITFFDEPLTVECGQDIKLPDRALVSGVAERQMIYGQACSFTFNPNTQMIPNDVLSSNTGVYLFHPIYNGKKLFGYMCCRISEESFYQHHIFLKIFSHGLALAFDYSKSLERNISLSRQNELLQIKNLDLDRESRTDELTKLLNRRGIIEMGQKVIDFSIEMNQKGVVFFGDMNYLKKINDTYGHEMGDIAIKTQAEIFKSVFRSNDIVGRLSGDEFVAIIPGYSINQIDNVRNKVSIKAKEISKEKNLPFEISISLGAVEFNSDNYNLQELIKKADANQYDEKRRIHANRTE